MNALVFYYVVEELAVLHELHDEEQLLGGLDYLVELDEVRVADEFEDVDLAGDALDVGHLTDFLLL